MSDLSDVRAPAAAQAPLLSKLFSPIDVNGLRLENRTMMSSIHLNLEEFDDQFERMARFYALRAEEGVGIIVTSGCSPDGPGQFALHGFSLKADDEIAPHRLITQAVHAKGGRIALQIIHFGREAVHGNLVSSSPLKLASSIFKPREMSHEEILALVDDYADCAARAIAAGYDAIELIFSQGFLVHQFLASGTNLRTDSWGGDFANRSRLAVLIAQRVRERVGPDYPVIYRIPCMDLFEGGMTADEALELIGLLKPYGIDLLSVSIGWHDSHTPTIAMVAPRAAFASATRLVRKRYPDLKLCVSNRINDPRVAENLLIDGEADMVAMARPFLADAALVSKARRNAFDEINPCIACNQNCLDYVFAGQPVGCSVNPEAVLPGEGHYPPLAQPLHVAVVGGGIAGMGAALFLARRGARVDLFEESHALGGQLKLAMQVPDKSEFHGTVRYYTQALYEAGVQVHLGTRFGAERLADGRYQHVVLASGCLPRKPDAIPGADAPHVLQYTDVLEKGCPVAYPVAIIGGGGVACDVAKFLVKRRTEQRDAAHAYLRAYNSDGSLAQYLDADTTPAAEVTMLQRSSRKFAMRLGRTTRWIQMGQMERLNIGMRNKLELLSIEPDGVRILDKRTKQEELVPARTVVLAAGHVPRTELVDALAAAGVPYSVIGAADTEGDASRATNLSSAMGQAYQLAMAL